MKIKFLKAFNRDSIVGVTEMGGFKCSHKNGMLFIQSGDNDQTLMLASGKAVKAF